MRTENKDTLTGYGRRQLVVQASAQADRREYIWVPGAAQDRDYGKTTKIHLVNTNVKSVLIYRAET